MTDGLRCAECGATETRTGKPFTPQGLASHALTHVTMICRRCGEDKPLNTIGGHRDRCAENPPTDIDPWWRAFPAEGWRQAIVEMLGFTEELPSSNAALVITDYEDPMYRGKGDAIREAAIALRANRPVVIVPVALLGELWQRYEPKRLRRVERDPHDDEYDDEPVTAASFLAAL